MLIFIKWWHKYKQKVIILLAKNIEKVCSINIYNYLVNNGIKVKCLKLLMNIIIDGLLLNNSNKL